ncbi:MAG: UDP-N-acetylglucosamine 1-carboxyvinyltransferase [Bacteriovoracaceae bacterium]
MDKLIINGPATLEGEIRISRAKNAFLPILSASILSDEKLTLNEVPNLRDINTMKRLLSNMGATLSEVEQSDVDKDNGIEIDPTTINNFEAPYELVKTMRASIGVLGPLLSKYKRAKVSLPGGCAIGARPVNFHLEAMKKLGANVEVEGGNIVAETSGLIGNKVTLPFPSVGATQNVLMAASLAKGETLITNAAKEPEVTDLVDYLIQSGVPIEGRETAELKIQGVERLKGISYAPIGDRIEAGTYLCLALMAKAKLKITGFNPKHIDFAIDMLKDVGANFEVGEDFVTVFPSELRGFSLTTAPYPGFPTDLQAQFMSLALTIDDVSTIRENIFENRFMHVPELKRFGAEIDLKENVAIIRGGRKLTGAPVMCTDLRASAALILTSLIAQGESEVRRVYHLDRGYDRIDQKISKCGGKVERVNE